MSNLQPCPGCANPVSRLAYACPKCGYELMQVPESEDDVKQREKEVSFKRVGIFIILFLLTITVGGRLIDWLNSKRPEVPEPPSRDQTATVRQSDYGAQWPLITSEAELICRNDPAHPDSIALLAKVAGKIYSLTWQPSNGGPAYKNISEVWRDDPATGTKISLQPLIEKAEDLCRKPHP